MNTWQRVKWMLIGAPVLLIAAFAANTIYELGAFSWQSIIEGSIGDTNALIEAWSFLSSVKLQSYVFSAMLLLSTYGLLIDSGWLAMREMKYKDEVDSEKVFWHMLGWLFIWNGSFLALVAY